MKKKYIILLAFTCFLLLSGWQYASASNLCQYSGQVWLHYDDLHNYINAGTCPNETTAYSPDIALRMSSETYGNDPSCNFDNNYTSCFAIADNTYSFPTATFTASYTVSQTITDIGKILSNALPTLFIVVSALIALYFLVKLAIKQIYKWKT